MTTPQIELPDTTAQAARAVGLLTPQALDRLLNEALRRRIQVAALPVVARTLLASLEELFGEDKKATRTKRGPASKWQQQIATRPRAKQQVVMQMLDGLLAGDAR